MDRSKLLDNVGRPLTQSLFLEFSYSPFAIYTLKDIDFDYEGRKLPSIKRLYLEMEDPTEYSFATEYFLGWNHWLRICENKQIMNHIQLWRDELEVKLRSRAVKMNIAAASAGNYQAAKWLADRGWQTRAAGRPSKDEIAKNIKIAENVANEYSSDVLRLKAV